MLRFWLPIKKEESTNGFHTLKVSVGGKSYDVQKDTKANGRPMVEIADLPEKEAAATIQHLIDKGWMLADQRTANVAREVAGLKLGPDNQPVVDETLGKQRAQ